MPILGITQFTLLALRNLQDCLQSLSGDLMTPEMDLKKDLSLNSCTISDYSKVDFNNSNGINKAENLN